jgi:hypothetical protein
LGEAAERGNRTSLHSLCTSSVNLLLFQNEKVVKKKKERERE